MKNDFLLPTGRWEAVELTLPSVAYRFDPGEWGMEFLPNGKMTVYLEGDPAGTRDYTFLDGMLSIDGGIPLKAELSGSELIIHDTDPDDGTPCRTLYRRV